jgi:hypothetical protein
MSMVRYADSPATDVSVQIAASAAVVWSLLSDINLPAQFSEEFVRAEWIDPGPEMGATFRGYNQHPVAGEWSALCTITGLESERVFEWTVGDPSNKVARWRFDVTPNGDGVTLRFSAEMGPAPSGLTPAIEKHPDREEAIVAGRLADWTTNMQRTVDGIKDLAEATLSR